MGFDELATAIADRIQVYRRTGDVQILLADAVQSEVDALLDAAEQERMAEARQLLGMVFFLRFDDGPGNLSDLANALLCHWPTDALPAGDPPEPLRVLLPGPDQDTNKQLDAAAVLFRHALSAGDLTGLQMTIALLESVVAAIPPWRQDRRVPLSRLIDANLCWHRLTGDVRAADEATALAERCLDTLTTQHQDRWWFLAAVAMARVGKVLRGSMSDIRDAIDLGEQALQQASGRTTLDGPADGMIPLPTQLKIGLGFTYEIRYSLGLARADLDRAIALREAVEPDWRDPGVVAALAKSLLARFDRTGEIQDLRRAVAAAKRFLAIADADDPTHDLATALVAAARQLPKGRRFRPKALVPVPDRGGFLKRLWLERLAPSRKLDADAVIILGECALSVTGLSLGLDETVKVPNPEDPATDRTLIRLSESYVRRFNQLGDKPDIDRAVALVELMRSPEGAGDLSKAARAYHVRFASSQSTSDLEFAVGTYEMALRDMNDDDPDRYWATCRLTEAYRTAAGISGDEDFLRRATDLAEQALAGIPAKSPARSTLLVALADIRCSWFHRSRDAGELARAIDLFRQAVTIDRGSSTLGSLGDAYFLRFDKLGDPDDLLLAIDAFGEALAMAQENTAIWLFAMSKYCAAYRELFTVNGYDTVDAGVVKKLADVSIQANHALPIHKALTCHAIGSLALAMGRPRTAIRVLDEAVGLLRSATWRDTGWSDQEAYLRNLRDLASDSVAAYLAVGDPAAAVEAAERGRAVTLGSELDLRTDVTGLARIHPALAKRLDEVRDRLNTQDQYDLVGAMRDTVGRNNRNNLWTEHDQLVEEVRQLPGFAGFLRPPRLTELRPAAEGGAVVLVNAAESRGDAVIVTSDGAPVPVPLPRLRIDDLRTHAAALLRAVTATPLTRSLRARRVLTDVLEWLWESTVEPVLTEVLPESRIWWLPTGMLGLFPLHAAGVTGQPGALDLAVSSYIPTLRALQHARRRARPATRRQLTVALGNTPGFPPIPGTTAEAAALRARHPDHPLLTDTAATPGKVLTALTDCTWAHFACHASADPATSARAVLHLHGGDLPVEAISRLRMDAAELAYLSACSTAARGLRADEPTNLASAFHLAGFRHVVATLWPLTDTAAAHAAQTFYDTLGEATTADDTAHTVRAVARELRAQYPHRPDLWAALIHSGP